MGKIAYQRTGGVMLRQDIFLPVNAQPPIYLPQLQQQIVGRIAFQQRRGGAIHGHDTAGLHHQLQFPLDIGMAVLQTLPQASHKRFRADDQLRKRQLVRLAKTQFEQGFRGRVHEQHPQPPVQHQHGDAQTFHNPTMVIFQHVCLVFRPPSVNKQKPNQFNTERNPCSACHICNPAQRGQRAVAARDPKPSLHYAP
jgi:hypothetical protein